MTDSDLPKGWSMFIDESSGYPCYVNDETGLTQWEKPKPEGGSTVELSEMENPMRASQLATKKHGRNSTKLPGGWDKHFTEEGDKYYANGDSGETSWVSLLL